MTMYQNYYHQQKSEESEGFDLNFTEQLWYFEFLQIFLLFSLSYWLDLENGKSLSIKIFNIAVNWDSTLYRISFGSDLIYVT